MGRSNLSGACSEGECDAAPRVEVRRGARQMQDDTTDGVRIGQVRWLSPSTQARYVQTVARFARHFGRSPAHLGPERPEQIRTYKVYLTTERRLAANSLVVTVALFAIAPWTLDDENQILRMDIPALGVDGACLSIIGQLGQSRCVLIFPSRHAFEQFREAAANSNPEQPRAAFGAGVLSLFHNATHLPPAMRPEAMQHG